jgi:hypothetical protein
LIGKFAFKVHDGVVGDRTANQASHKLLSVGGRGKKVGDWEIIEDKERVRDIQQHLLVAKAVTVLE